MSVIGKPFRDANARIGRPRNETKVDIKGKSIRFQLLDSSHIELHIPNMKPVKITKKNAKRLALWLLDNIGW